MSSLCREVSQNSGWSQNVLQFQTYQCQSGFDKKALIEAFKCNMNHDYQKDLWSLISPKITLRLARWLSLGWHMGMAQVAKSNLDLYTKPAPYGYHIVSIWHDFAVYFWAIFVLYVVFYDSFKRNHYYTFASFALFGSCGVQNFHSPMVTCKALGACLILTSARYLGVWLVLEFGVGIVKGLQSGDEWL